MEWTMVSIVWNSRALLLNVARARVFPPWAAGARGPYRAGPRWCAARVRARASWVGPGTRVDCEIEISFHLSSKL